MGPGPPLKFLVKDLGLALELADELGVSLPQGRSAGRLLNAAAEQGLLEQDVGALVLPLEKAGAGAGGPTARRRVVSGPMRPAKSSSPKGSLSSR